MADPNALNSTYTEPIGGILETIGLLEGLHRLKDSRISTREMRR